MAGEAEAVFDAQLLIDVKRSCTLFVTDNRIVVAIPEGMDSRISGIVVVAFAICLTGLILMNAAIFTVGLIETFAVTLLLVLANFIVRYRNSNKIRRLRLNEILRGGKENFEIRYPDIVKVRHEPVRRRDTSVASHILLPSLPYTSHLIDLETQKSKYTFIIEESDVEVFMDLMKQSFPEEKIEEKQASD